MGSTLWDTLFRNGVSVQVLIVHSLPLSPTPLLRESLEDSIWEDAIFGEADMLSTSVAWNFRLRP